MKQKFAVIGHPIGHSLSPDMHNASFKELGIDGSYQKIEIKEEELGEFMKKAKNEFSGLNVTIPHKVAVMDYLDGLDKSAKAAGAVNTVHFSKSGAIGYNTDGMGAIDALEKAFKSKKILHGGSGESAKCKKFLHGVEDAAGGTIKGKNFLHGGEDAAGGTIKGKKILLIGAGGAAKGIASEAIMRGALLTICNRTKEKAEKLARDVGKAGVVAFDEKAVTRAVKDSDIVINATSMGMEPRTDKTPLTKEQMRPGLTVMDIVYNPLKTQLLKEAEGAGAIIISGVDMFVFQGAEAEKIWLGVEPPVETMRKTVMEILND